MRWNQLKWPSKPGLSRTGDDLQSIGQRAAAGYGALGLVKMKSHEGVSRNDSRFCLQCF